MNTHEVQAHEVDSSHANRGYPEGFYGSHIAYHFLIGRDGTVKQNRSLSERSGHTKNQAVNLSSIAIGVAGDFSQEKPSQAQLDALRGLIRKLDGVYTFTRIIGHKDASATACPGKHLLEAIKDLLRQPKPYRITRYYTPVKGQTSYYRDSYEADFQVNCSGDCLVTSSGYKLKPEDAFKVAACPPELPFGLKLNVEGLGQVICQDRGGAITDKKLDIWAGVGDAGLQNIRTNKVAGLLSVTMDRDSCLQAHDMNMRNDSLPPLAFGKTADDYCDILDTYFK